MKILHIYKDYHPVVGGIENHVRLLAQAQARQGHAVTVLVTNLSAQTTSTEMEGVRVIRAGRLVHIASTPLSLAFFAQLRRLQADIAHLHFPYPPGELGNLLLRPGRRTVITYHSDVIRQRSILRLYDPLLRMVLRQAARIIATSPNYVESSPYLRAFADKCLVVPLGIDPTPFLRRDDHAVAIRKRFQVEPGSGSRSDDFSRSYAPTPDAMAMRQTCRPLMLFVGRLRYYKGLNYLVEAMHEVNATLLVVGTGPLESELRQLAWNWGLQERVHFVGEVADSELPAYFQACDLFVLPASQRSEAFGLVLLEAMAAGKPVISTELGTGASFVNQDGKTGFVVPPRDVRALAQAINRLLADSKQRKSMGEQGRQRVLKCFSVNQMVDGVNRVYESALTGGD